MRRLQLLSKWKAIGGFVLLVTALCSEAMSLPRGEMLKSGAARYEASRWTVSAADEAVLFTPAGFTKPGKLVAATGRDVCHLKITVRDKATGKPTFCRVNVVGADGNYYQPAQNSLASFTFTENAWTSRVDGLPRANRPGVPPVRYCGRFFYCSGDISVDVPPGPVRVEVWKGFEYRPAVVATHVNVDSEQAVEVSIERTLSMADHQYYSGDPHLHFPRKTEADDEVVLDMMEADDIHFGSILAYNDPPGPYAGVMKTLASPQMRGLGRNSIRTRGDYHILSGQEYRSTTYGHINLYMQDGIALPDQKINADDWPMYGDLGNELQKIGGFAFYAHGGYAQSIYADFVQGGVSGVELLQFAVYRGIGLDDWYHMLNCGYRFPALGASDYPWCRLLGDSKTFVHMDGEPGFAKWLRGAAEGSSFVTSGPMLLLELNDPSKDLRAHPGEQVTRDGKGPHPMTARVRVCSDVAPVTNVQIIVNGEVVEELVTPVDQGTGRWISLERPLKFTESSWVAARAFAKTSTGAPNAEAHTNPIYVYLDGKAPYRQASLDKMVAGIDRQIEYTKHRDFEKKADVLAYFQRSRETLLKIRAAGGAAVRDIPSVSGKAQQHDEKVTDSNRAADSLKDILKPIPAKTPAEALKTFETVDGFQMQLVAQEPLVCDPIAAAFDENGQLYVCEDRDYPYRPKPGEKPLSTVRLLRDTNGDGVFDESHVFADGLLWASGVVPWKGGVFVAAAPEIWYLKDTDGDFNADVRTKIFTGFGTQNQQAMLNNLVFGPDHMIYGSTAGNGGTIHSGTDPKDKGVAVKGHDFRFDPRNPKLETITGTVQFGNCFDDWGNRFMCSQSSPLLYAALPENYLKRNPYVAVPSAIDDLAGSPVPIFRISPIEAWRQIRSSRRVAQDRPATADGVSHHVVDAAAGVTVYRGAAYGDQYYGNVFVCDAENNLVHRRTLTPHGATFQSKRADEKTEFVRSSDNWFRPVNLVNAPDGTLYVLDMSREIIESIHIPSDVAKHLDLTNGRNQGRIYRTAPRGFRYVAPPRLGEASAEQLVAALDSPNGWHRDTANRLIFEQQSSLCVPLLRDLLKSGKTPQGRMLALWSLYGLAALTESDLSVSLEDKSANVREQAIRLAEPRLDSSPKILNQVLAQTLESSPRIAFQLAFSLGQTKDERAITALARIAKEYPGDSWICIAVFSSSVDSADKLFLELVKDAPFADSRAGTALLARLAQIVGAQSRTDEVARLIDALGEHSPRSASPGFRDTILLGLGAGLKQAGARLPAPANLLTAAAESIRAAMSAAKNTALDRAAKEGDRRQAIALLACLDFKTSQASLVKLLDPLDRQSVQLAALDALGGYKNSEVASVIIDEWPHFAPAVRARAIRLMLSRDEWSQVFLAAVENHRASVAEIDPSNRTQLLHHPNESIRTAAAKLFAGSPRAKVIDDYRAVLTERGDPEHGALIFQRECTACHRLGGRGTAIGPDLSSSLSRDGEALLINILDPNRFVQPNFMQYLAIDKSGRSVPGLLSAETATSITLTTGQGSETLLRTNIDELVCTSQSLMPDGFEQKISKAEMADVLAYLGDSIEANPSNEQSKPDIGTLPGLVEPTR